MMAEKEPSHAELAEAHIQNAVEVGLSRPVAQEWIALARVEATLAVAAEQKRVADWLEAWPLAHDGSPVTSPNAVY